MCESVPWALGGGRDLPQADGRWRETLSCGTQRGKEGRPPKPPLQLASNFQGSVRQQGWLQQGVDQWQRPAES